MVLDKLLLASYKGIQFHTEQVSDEVNWNHQTSEYITGEEANTVRYSKAARSFPVSGFLLGKDANLTKDFLIAATEEEKPGKLIHPLFGIKNAVCVSRKINTLGVSAYHFQLEFKEVLVDEGKSLLDEATRGLDKLNSEIAQLGLKFYGYVSQVLQANYLMDQAVKTLEKLDSFIDSANGVALIPRSIGSLVYNAEKTRGLLRDPQPLYIRMQNSAASIVVKGSVNSVASGLEEARRDNRREIESFITATLIALIAIEEAKKGEGPLDREVYQPLFDLFFEITAKPGERPMFKEVFPLVWDQVQRLKDVEKHDVTKGKPSLVVAYEKYGDLNRAKELARYARQPFKVNG